MNTERGGYFLNQTLIVRKRRYIKYANGKYKIAQNSNQLKRLRRTKGEFQKRNKLFLNF